MLHHDDTRFLEVDRSGRRVVVEWRNGRAPADRKLLSMSITAWCAVSGVLAFLVLVKDPRTFTFVGQACVLALGVAWYQLTLVFPMRWCRERVVIDAGTVRHRHVGLPWPGQRLRVEDLTRLELARAGTETTTTVRLHAGRRSMNIGGILDLSAKRDVFAALAPVLLEVRPDLLIEPPIDADGGSREGGP